MIIYHWKDIEINYSFDKEYYSIKCILLHNDYKNYECTNICNYIKTKSLDLGHLIGENLFQIIIILYLYNILTFASMY